MTEQIFEVRDIVAFTERTAVAFEPNQTWPGATYVALDLPWFDGHEHVVSAVKAGASSIVIDSKRMLQVRQHLREEELDTRIFPVASSLAAFRGIARAKFAQRTVDAIVVAGSAGKTTTRRLLAEMLERALGPILESRDNQNGFFGVAATALRLRPEHRVALLEVGIDATGAMDDHLDLIRPDSSILTAIGYEHLGGLRDIDTIFAEQRLVIDRVAANGGIVAVNLDDPLLATLGREIGNHRPLIGYTLSKRKGAIASHIEILEGSYSPSNDYMIVNGLGLRRFRLPLPLPGAHNARNVLGALALARSYGASGEHARMALTDFRPLPGRSELKELSSGTRLICDYFNASPLSMQSALELLNESADSGSGVRWACLGDMLDLGDKTCDLHRALAPILVKSNVDHVLLFGDAMACLADELRFIGFAGRVRHFDCIDQLAAAVHSGVAKNANKDSVLIKGSRAMKMERVETFLQTSDLR